MVFVHGMMVSNLSKIYYMVFVHESLVDIISYDNHYTLYLSISPNPPHSFDAHNRLYCFYLFVEALCQE